MSTRSSVHVSVYNFTCSNRDIQTVRVVHSLLVSRFDRYDLVTKGNDITVDSRMLITWNWYWHLMLLERLFQVQSLRETKTRTYLSQELCFRPPWLTQYLFSRRHWNGQAHFCCKWRLSTTADPSRPRKRIQRYKNPPEKETFSVMSY